MSNANLTRDELFTIHDELTAEAKATMAKKNEDYAHNSDVFRNFRMFGSFGVLVRMSDKLARLRTFEERGVFSVTDESVRDTIEDLINYAVIYYAMIREGDPKATEFQYGASLPEVLDIKQYCTLER